MGHKKKNEILPFGTVWVDPEGITPSEKSQSPNITYYTIPFILLIFSDRLVVTKGAGSGRVEIGVVTKG